MQSLVPGGKETLLIVMLAVGPELRGNAAQWTTAVVSKMCVTPRGCYLQTIHSLEVKKENIDFYIYFYVMTTKPFFALKVQIYIKAE